ncbi:hypothetical protein [Streptomyces sp. NPDC006333]|uniref:hypothetical protein n=1 Tax=Streptomyces sp. NPDC006333 TaxID=3156753 RepID=UPI0033A6BA78
MNRRISWDLFSRAHTLLSSRRFELMLLTATSGALIADGLARLVGARNIAALCWGLDTVTAVEGGDEAPLETDRRRPGTRCPDRLGQ